MNISVVSDGDASSGTYVLNGLAKHSKHNWKITQFEPDMSADMVYVHAGILFNETSPQLKDLMTLRKDVVWVAGLRGELNYKKWAVNWNPTTQVRDFVYQFKAISCSNQHYLNEMLKFGFNAYYCPSATDSTLFSEQPFPSEFTIGFVGSPEHGEKNYRVFSRLPFKQKVADSSVPYEKMIDFYRDVSVVICCSHNEGSPVPPKEAAFCGKPTVAFPVGDIPSWLPLDLIAGDEADMVSIIERMEKNPSWLANRGRLCRQQVEKYDFKSVVKSYDSMLESCFFRK